ncbi:MAG: hypothetical protein P8O79_15020 [Halieaceae bacterium]|nr:hypothetical protein [Halieaceae bacterium]
MRIGTIFRDLSGTSDSGPQSLHEVMRHDWTVFVTIPTANRDENCNELWALGACIEEEFRTSVSVVGVCDPADLGWLGHAKQTSGFGSRNLVAFWSCEDGSIASDGDDQSRIFFSESFEKSKVALIVGPDRRLHLSMRLPAWSALNALEIVRSLKALMVVWGRPLATPANWEFGEDVIVRPSLDDASAERDYGPVRKVLSYLRYVKSPLQLLSSPTTDRE